GRAARFLTECPNDTLGRFIARRIVETEVDAGLQAVLLALQDRARPGSDLSFQREGLEGGLEAGRGLKRVRIAAHWPDGSRGLAERGASEVRARLDALGLLLGDAEAESGLRSVVENRSAGADARLFALRNLVDRRTAGLAPLLFRLLDDPGLRGPAIRALAAYNDPATPRALLKRYTALSPAERDDAIATLASRPAWASALLDA